MKRAIQKIRRSMVLSRDTTSIHSDSVRWLAGILYVVCVAWVILAMSPVHAHTSERILEPVTKHEGIGKRAGPFNVEYVGEGRCASLYVHSNSNVPQSVSGATASVSVFSDGNKTTLALAPAGGNHLHGCGAIDIGSAVSLVVRLTMYGKPPVAVMIRAVQESRQ